jgi:hypothetical protein
MQHGKLGNDTAGRDAWSEKADCVNRNTYMTVTATLLLAVAIVYLARIIFGWNVEIGGLSIPSWGELAGRSCSRCARIFRDHAEAIVGLG